MIATITAYLTGSTLGPVALVALATWILGMFGQSAWYRKVREAVGRVSMAGGVALSAIGNSKLKSLWNPIEQVFCDFLFFAVEQFAAGLRKDNLDKMDQQLLRLSESGSVTRANAIAEKIALLEQDPPMQSHQDAAMFHRAFKAADESINMKKEG